MEGIFAEFENENALRSYPFASGCVPPDEGDEIPSGVFVDAAIYPVNPVGTIYLSSVSEDGVFSISDGGGVIMTGSAAGSTVELRDTSALSRHVGTLVASSPEALAEFAGRGVEREYEPENTAFASSCVFPIVIDGVESVDVAETGMVAGTLEFANGRDDVVRVSSESLGEGKSTLRFDVVPELRRSSSAIRRVICVVDGQTPFRISKHESSGYNSVILTLDGIDKETVCASAHRENEYEMVDACKCEKRTTSHVDYPDTYQMETVDMASDFADNAFYLIVPNLTGYYNPLSITLEDGVVVPKPDGPEVVVNGNTADLAEGENADSVGSKGVVIQVPGLSGGMI